MQFKDQNKLKAVTFSYDDGVTQDIHLIQLLNKYNLQCTFNLNSELLGKRGILLREGQNVAHYKLAPEDVKGVYVGHEVAVHTLTHPNLTQLPEEEIVRQVEEDRKNLEALTGGDVVGMAYPCGGVNNDERVAAILKEKTRVQYSRTITSSHSFAPQENLYRFNPTVYHLEWDKLFELGREFVALQPAAPQIFYIWGHSYELDYDTSYWAKLEAFFQLIANREDIFYGTNREVLL